MFKHIFEKTDKRYNHDDRASVNEIGYLTTHKFCYEMLFTEQIDDNYIYLNVFANPEHPDYGTLLEDFEYGKTDLLRIYRARCNDVDETDEQIEALTLQALKDYSEH